MDLNDKKSGGKRHKKVADTLPKFSDIESVHIYMQDNINRLTMKQLQAIEKQINSLQQLQGDGQGQSLIIKKSQLGQATVSR